MSYAHGTANRYRNKGCRCDPCRAAWVTYMRDWKRARVQRGGCRTCGDPAVPGLGGYCRRCRDRRHAFVDFGSLPADPLSRVERVERRLERRGVIVRSD